MSQLGAEQAPDVEELTQLRAQLAQAQREVVVLRQENETNIMMDRQTEEFLAKTDKTDNVLQ